MHTVGICGSDIHYYEHGKIGQWHVMLQWFWVTRVRHELLRLGIMKNLKVGDRVCIEPQVVVKNQKNISLECTIMTNK